MKKGILLLLFVSVACLSANAQYVSLSNNEFAQLKNLIANDATAKAAFEPFQIAADKALKEDPDPIEHITSEGKLAGNPDKIKSLKAVEDGYKIYSLALVYKLYNNKACLDKATEYLTAWAKVNRSTGDPIDETKLEDLITGYDIIRNDVSPAPQKAIDNWLQDIADGELDSEHARAGKGTATNNWNSHRIKIMALVVYTIHNNKYEKIIQRELTKQIAVNLYADGTGADFKERDAFHYHIYTLEPLITTATIIYRASEKDYFNYESETGSSMKKSIDFMVPYVTGEKTHGEFLNSKTPFDRARAKNGEKDYQPGALFKPLTAVHVLEQAAYFNPKYLDVVKQVTSTNGGHNDDWQLILNKARKPYGTN